MAILSVITRIVNARYQTSQALIASSCPFVAARASLFTDHRMFGLSVCGKYEHFRTIQAQTFDLEDSKSS